MGKCVFLPGWFYRGTEEEEERLDDIQDELSFFHITFDQENRNLSEHERKEKKAQIHFKIRQSMTVIK